MQIKHLQTLGYSNIALQSNKYARFTPSQSLTEDDKSHYPKLFCLNSWIPIRLIQSPWNQNYYNSAQQYLKNHMHQTWNWQALFTFLFQFQ